MLGNPSDSISRADAHIAWASGDDGNSALAATSSHLQGTWDSTSGAGAFGCFLNQATSRKALDLLRSSRAPGISAPGFMSGQEARMSSSERPVRSCSVMMDTIWLSVTRSRVACGALSNILLDSGVHYQHYQNFPISEGDHT